jgi:prepilin-type N-terminal cleavage/methylation domain-containing protein
LLWQQSKYNSAGFSLLELSVVLLLIALLAMLTGAQTSFLDRIVIRSELEQLYTTCYYLQRCAMAHNKSEQLIFDIPHNRYRYHQTEHTLPAQICFGTSSGMKGPPSSPDHLVTNPISFKNNTIIFHPNGLIEPGTVYITDTKQRYSYALSSAVAQVSYLRKYQYTNQWISL